MKVVNSHLKVLVDQKAIRERRRIGILTIVKESGASRSAVQRMLNNTIRNVPLDDLKQLCEYLHCTPGDILRLDEIPDSE